MLIMIYKIKNKFTCTLILKKKSFKIIKISKKHYFKNQKYNFNKLKFKH